MECRTCDRVKTVLSLLFTVVMAAALLGAYYAHGTIAELQFGTTEASLSILAVVITLMLWTKNLDCSNCPNLRYQQWVVFGILILATIASFIGMYRAHIGVNELVVGTRNASLSIIAFAVTATYWAKQVQKICGQCSLQVKEH
jgi:carbon starvation protein CstA